MGRAQPFLLLPRHALLLHVTHLPWPPWWQGGPVARAHINSAQGYDQRPIGSTYAYCTCTAASFSNIVSYTHYSNYLLQSC